MTDTARTEAGGGQAAGTGRVRPAGDAALLLDCAGLDEVLGLAEALRRARAEGRPELDDITDVVPAARTLLVGVTGGRAGSDRLRRELERLEPVAPDETGTRHHEIPVRYDGEDLGEVAELLGITPDEVIARHTGSRYTVAFAGFAPGFAYLTGGHPSLDVPRRQTPRTRIPAGAVGLAGTFSGIYPRESPGGWQLLGRTDVPLWDETRDLPALLQPGDTVRFVAADASAPPAPDPANRAVPARTGVPGDAAALRIEVPGLRPLIQDAGRPGHTDIGVPPSGALDAPSLREANFLVGNDPHAPALELTLGGFRAVAVGILAAAVTGAPAPITITRADGETEHIADMRSFALQDGDVLDIGVPATGMRSYLALRGGIVARRVLGSAATDTLSGLGPAPLAAGDELQAGPPPKAAAGHPQVWPAMPGETLEVPVVMGPREDWFTADSRTRLLEQSWRITPESDRVGMRLDGETPLERAITGELPSEGTVTGALQVPPSGLPVLFLNDRPVTGGYPVIAVVRDRALPLLAQARPGTVLRFYADG